MANQYSNPLKIVPATVRQKRQRKLAFLLRICVGFEASIKQFAPPDTNNLPMLLRNLEIVINNIRYELRNIE